MGGGVDRIEDGRMDSGQATCPLGWELEGDQRKGFVAEGTARVKISA